MQRTQRYKQKKLRSSVVLLFAVGFLIGIPLGNLIASSQAPVWGRLTIAYGSEKATWMGVVQVAFSKWWQETYPDKPIKTDFTAYGSVQSLVGMLNGEIKPVIWSPAASVWIPQLDAQWGALVKGQSIIENVTKVIFSPVVMATWQSFNQTYNITGLDSLHSLIVNSPGVVKMAHTDPTLSNSGFMAVIMAVAAALNKDSGNITYDNLLDPSMQTWLREFESAAVQYGESTGFLGKMMVNSGPTALNIALLYENVVKDISNQYKGDKIIAIYPEEGTLYSDHPFCILNASWVSPNDKFVAYKFAEFIQRQEILELAMKSGFRPINTSIPLNTDIFNFQNYGISPSFTSPEMHVPQDGVVLSRIPDIWSLTRSVI